MVQFLLRRCGSRPGQAENDRQRESHSHETSDRADEYRLQSASFHIQKGAPLLIAERLLLVGWDGECVDLGDDSRVGPNDGHAASFRWDATADRPGMRSPSCARQAAGASAPIACRGFARRRDGASSRKGAGLPMPSLVLFDDDSLGGGMDGVRSMPDVLTPA